MRPLIPTSQPPGTPRNWTAKTRARWSGLALLAIALVLLGILLGAFLAFFAYLAAIVPEDARYFAPKLLDVVAFLLGGASLGGWGGFRLGCWLRRPIWQSRT